MKKLLLLITMLLSVLQFSHAAEYGADKSKCQYCYEVIANVVNARSQPSVESDIVYGILKGDVVYVDYNTLFDGSGFKWVKISGEETYVVATYLTMKENPYYVASEDSVDKSRSHYDVWQYGFNALPRWLVISMLVVFALLSFLFLLLPTYSDFLGKKNENGMRKILFFTPGPYKVVANIAACLLAAFALTIVLFIAIGGLVWLFSWTARIALVVVFWLIVVLACVAIVAIAYGLTIASGGGCIIVIIIGAIAACVGAVNGLIDSVQDYFYGWGESVVDWGNRVFEVFNVFSLALYIVKTYWTLALIVALTPMLLFLACAVVFLIFAGILILTENIIMKRYNVKHPCPHCGRPSEPAVYLSHGVPLPVNLHPGVWGIFSITHPQTGEKMPTLFLNGKDMLERQCFTCKNSVSAQVGAERHIAIAGVPSSGKSTLIYRLVAELLRKKIGSEHVAFFTDDMGMDEAAVKNFIKTIENGEEMSEFPLKTQEGRHKAIQLLVQNPDHYVPYRLFVNDIAGEMFTAERSNVEDAPFLMNTKVLMFILDPFTIDFSSTRLSPRMKEWYDANVGDNERDRRVKIDVAIDALANMVEKYAKRGKNGVDMKLRIVLAKTDTGYLGKMKNPDQEELKQFIFHDLGLEAEMFNLSTMFKEISFAAISAAQQARESGIDNFLSGLLDDVGIDLSKVTEEGLKEKKMKLMEMKRLKKLEDKRFEKKVLADMEAERYRLEQERKRQEEERRRQEEEARRREEEERLKAEEERRIREEEERKAREEEAKRIEAAAGLTFTKCDFANVDYDNNIITDYDQPLYSENMRYLHMRYHYEAEKDMEDLTFMCKIINPSRELMKGDSSPAGYTRSFTINVTKGSWLHKFGGWGNNSKSIFPPGEYVVELWRNGYKLYSDVVVIKAR